MLIISWQKFLISLTFLINHCMRLNFNLDLRFIKMIKLRNTLFGFLKSILLLILILMIYWICRLLMFLFNFRRIFKFIRGITLFIFLLCYKITLLLFILLLTDLMLLVFLFFLLKIIFFMITISGTLLFLLILLRFIFLRLLLLNRSLLLSSLYLLSVGEH